ncbi:MAG: MFS transporter [Betaproteobacteria bacterium]|nr:MFS transporter [Betaproteobacteria bacterium]
MHGFLAALLRLRAFEVLRYREYRLLSLGQISGNMGTWMDEVSRGWLIYELTDSAVQLGLVRGIQVIPFLFLAPLAGSAADRYSRKTQLLLAQALNGIVFAATALLVFTGLIRPWHVYVAALLVAAGQVFQFPARAAMVSDTVPPENLTNAIGLGALIFNAARIIGPALAGALIAVSGTGSAFSVQALLLFFATLWTVQLRPLQSHSRGAHNPPKESFAQSIIEGWKFSWRSEPVRAGMLCTMLASLLIAPFTTLLPVFARDLLGVGASGQGLLLTAMGMGAVTSSALIASAGHKLARGMLMLGSSMIYGFLVAIFAASSSFGLSLAVMVFSGLCHVHSNALVQTVIQSYAPPGFRGRAVAIFSMNQVLVTLGSMLIGALSLLLGARWAVAAMGVAGSLAMIAMYVAMPRARQIR